MNTINKIKRIAYLFFTRRKNHNKDFTIISQNCIGGVIYSNLGVQFQSPTVNMLIENEDFVRFVENLEEYMSYEPVPLDNSGYSYPVIMLGDIKLHCMHYKDNLEAIEAWQRRQSRINYNNLYVIACSWNMREDYDLMKRINDCGYENVIFTYEKTNLKNEIVLPGDKWYKDKNGVVRPIVTDMIPYSYHKYFETFFDYVRWLNR